MIFTGSLLDRARKHLSGFQHLEKELISWLQKTYGTDVELLFAHGLRQSPDTMPSTTFDVHRTLRTIS